MTLYVDGVSVGTATTSGGADAPLSITLGKDSPSGSWALYDGLLDEMVVIPSALSAEGVQLLIEGAYPAANVTPASSSFSLPADTTSTVSGAIEIEADAPSSVQSFEHVAEAAIVLPEEDILIPIIDQNESDLVMFMPFEDVPFATTFEDIVDTNEGSCSDDTCPTSALRGLIDRAVYFDGEDDYMTHDRPSVLEGSISVAAWVKADRGTIIDTRDNDQIARRGLQLDVNQFNLRIGDVNSQLYDESLAFEIPENEWTHIAGVYDSDSNMAYVYVNGTLVTSAATYSGYHSDYGLGHDSTYHIGRNKMGHDPLHGWLDDLRVYDIALSASDVQALYDDAAPLMRFEFDEESDATAFVDATLNEYSGQPITTECAAVNLDTLTVTSLTTDTSDVYINLADEQLEYVNDVSSGTSTELTGSSILCESAALEVGLINTSGTITGTQTVDPTVAGSGSYNFISGSDNLTVTWQISDEPSYKVSPQPGTDGQIGNVALFDGEGYIEVPDASSELELISDFTIMTWINTTETGVGILAKNDDDTTWELGEKLFYLDGSGYPTFVGHSNEYIRSATVANQGVWTHVAASWDASAGTGKIYINGVDATSNSTYAANHADNAGDTIKIGSSNHNSNEAGNHFTGQMDELAVYQRTLSDEEIDSIYLREVRWYRERAAFAITIDADAPEISLLSDYAYRANQYTTLAVGTSDDTSYVQLVDVGIQAPTATDYSWQDAPVCLDSANGAAWCPTFDPTSLDGEGAYNLQIRAVDAVGHETTSEVTTIYVDDSAPQASSTYSGEWLSVTSDEENLSWSISLTGNVSDPALTSGDAGSGLLTDQVEITLLDAAGNAYGEGSQLATVSSNVWSVDYLFTGLRPEGLLTIQVSAEDMVGNASTTDVGTIRVDTRPPSADFNSWAVPTDTITSTVTIAGTVIDQLMPSGSVLKLHVDHNDGAGTFYDSSREDNHVTCTTCPTVTTGLFGNGLTFAGSAIDLGATATDDLLFTNGTLSAWIYPTWTASGNGYDPAILGISGASGTRMGWHISDDYQTMSLVNGSQTESVTVSLTPNQWAHVALVMDDGTWTGYLNGVSVGSVTQSFGTITDTLSLNIGFATSAGEYLTGQLDELNIFDRPLFASEINALAQNGRGVDNMTLTLEPSDVLSASSSIVLPANTVAYLPFSEENDGTTQFADNSGNGNNATCSGTACPSAGATGQIGSAPSFDGSDDLLTIANTSDINLGTHTEYTIAAWFWVDDKDISSRKQVIYEQGGGVRGLNLYIYDGYVYGGGWNRTASQSNWAGSHISSDAITSEGWHHVALTLSGTNTVQPDALKLYVDGVLVGSAEGSQLWNHNGNIGIGAVNGRSRFFDNDTSQGHYFGGTIDELVIVDVALTADEIAQLVTSESPISLSSTTILTPTLASQGNILSTWSVSIPTELENYYYINADAEDTSGNSTTVSRPLWQGVIDTAAPRITFDGTTGFTIEDFFLSESGLVHPCSAGDLVRTYNATSGQLHTLSATCNVSGASVTACDIWGNCATETNSSAMTQADEARLASLAADKEALYALSDSLPPTITITTPVLTSTHYTEDGQLRLSGTVTDTSGVANVEVVIDRSNGGEPITVGTILNGERWTALWFEPNAPTEGTIVNVTAIATNALGETSQISRDVLLDLSPPAPVEFTLSHDGEEITVNHTIRTLSPTLSLAWTESEDGSGLLGYEAGWAVRSPFSATDIISDIITFYAPDSPRLDEYVSSEGVRLSPYVSSIDTHGNRDWQLFGPIVVDTPFTPDYIQINDPEGTYHGWMEHQCSLIGVDRRINQHTSELETLHNEQRFYTTWDSSALRLAWTGANWNNDGDLFIYLDTQEGGTSALYNPYPASAGKAHLFLPGVTPFDKEIINQINDVPINGRTDLRRRVISQRPHPMRANYVLWVKDEQNALLLAWNNETKSWDETEALTSEKYQFSPTINNGQTDLLIPFNSLGIDAPDETVLKMLAIASNENDLRPWSTMPQTNHVTDQRLLKTAAYIGEAQFFAFTHRYEWAHLGQGACPNGKLGPPMANDYLDTDLELTLTTDHAATTAGYFGDSLFWLWDIILGGGPDLAPPGMGGDGPPIPGAHQLPAEGRDNQISNLGDIRANFRDTDHDLVQNGQIIQYTLNYENKGSDTARGVTANISSFFALRLPAGEHLPDEKRDHLVLELGDIPAGATGSTVFTATVDVPTAHNEYYTPCLEEYPDFTRGCEIVIDWAALDILFYDDAHLQNNQLVEWLWIDHPVDNEPAEFVGLQQPENIVPLGDVTFSGYAYDPSGVPTINLKIIFGEQSTVITCPDSTPTDGQWSCTVDLTTLEGAGDLQEGRPVVVEVQATDGAGYTTPWTPGYRFTVDATAPETTVTAQGPILTQSGQYASNREYTLAGVLTDNQDVAAVEVCTAGAGDTTCDLLNLQGSPKQYTYDDIPASPLPIGGDRSCQPENVIWRTFNVTDDFIIGEVSVGINITHPFRNDIEVELYSPEGERRRIVYGKKHQFSPDENLDIFLSDDAQAEQLTAGDDNPNAPYYDRHARPHQPLNVFHGQPSAGEWRLQICDDVPNADTGTYNHARLILTPKDRGTRTTTWRHQVPIADQSDAVMQTLNVTAIDSLGNRSNTPEQLSILIDNVAPVISVTHIIQNMLLPTQGQALNQETTTNNTTTTPTQPGAHQLYLPLLQHTGEPTTTPTTTTISGTTTDGGQLTTHSIIVRAPNGDTTSEELTLTGDQWSHTLNPTQAGTYQLRIRAIDEAGNATQSEAYEVEVYELTERLWLPVIGK